MVYNIDNIRGSAGIRLEFTYKIAMVMLLTITIVYQ